MENPFRLGALIVLGLLMTGCAQSKPDRNYFFSIGSGPSKGCTVSLDEIIESAISRNDPPVLGDATTPDLDFSIKDDQSTANWTLRKFQIIFENALDQTLKSTSLQQRCGATKKNFYQKWLASYSLHGTDPDQDLDRFEEYLQAVSRVVRLARTVPVRPHESLVPLFAHKAQWCGDPSALPPRPETHSPGVTEQLTVAATAQGGLANAQFLGNLIRTLVSELRCDARSHGTDQGIAAAADPGRLAAYSDRGSQ